MGHKGSSEVIAESECETLHGLLKLLRSGKHPAWLGSFLESLTIYADADEKPDARPVGPKEIVSSLLDSVGDTAAESIHGIVYLRRGDKFTTISQKEHEMMLRFLELQRAGDWLAKFVDTQCRLYAEGHRQNPKEVIEALAGNELEEFDCGIETTRKMLKEYPELFQAEVEQLAKVPAQSVEPKTEPTRYQLTTVADGEVKDPANITRAEFQELKKHLATMRKRKAGKGRKAA
jgi:hypothetical protein